MAEPPTPAEQPQPAEPQPAEPQPADRPQPAPGPDTARRLAEIFGDVLPESTSDDEDPAPPANSTHWYLENRPPHHDRD